MASVLAFILTLTLCYAQTSVTQIDAAHYKLNPVPAGLHCTGERGKLSSPAQLRIFYIPQTYPSLMDVCENACVSTTILPSMSLLAINGAVIHDVGCTKPL